MKKEKDCEKKLNDVVEIVGDIIRHERQTLDCIEQLEFRYRMVIGWLLVVVAILFTLLSSNALDKGNTFLSMRNCGFGLFFLFFGLSVMVNVSRDMKKSKERK